MKHFFALFAFLLFAGPCAYSPLGGSGGLRAQNLQELSLKAFLSNDAAAWDKAIAAAGDDLVKKANLQLSAAYAAMGAEDTKRVEALADALDDNLDTFWEQDDKNAAAHGIYSGLLGLKIALSPMKGMVLGSRASSYAEDGVKLGPNDHIALYSQASNLFYTPEQWGGDLKKAHELLETAAATFGNDAGDDWNYLQILALKGQAEKRLGDTDAARATYQLALNEQPGFNYVKYHLLPQLK